MTSHLHKGNFGLSFALSIACTISILLISAVTVSAQTFSTTGSMSVPRGFATSTQLLNGKVLVAGGEDDTGLTRGVAELYNPPAGTFTTSGSIVLARSLHTATLLANGKVLIVGGLDNNGTPTSEITATAELYNPSTGTFTSTGSLPMPRYLHVATLLCSGKVLITGGATGTTPDDSSAAEIYDPATGAFTTTGSMVNGRTGHTATLLPDCKVLIAGGDSNSSATAELYDPSAGTFTATGSMITGRAAHTATLLLDGRVLVAGGIDTAGTTTNTAEIYDASSGTFSSAGSMATARGHHIARIVTERPGACCRRTGRHFLTVRNLSIALSYSTPLPAPLPKQEA